MRNVGKISRKYFVNQILVCFLVCQMLFGLPAQVVRAATPVVGAYDPSDAAISQTDNTTTVNLLAEQAIINWDNFNTLDGELLQFLRNNGLSAFAVLNRVSGGGTEFNGDLEAIKGTVFILNPNGITFGPTAYVQARNLVASSMKMSDGDFLEATAGATISGDMEFTNPYSYEGARLVANYGTITGADSVYLVGKNVLNAGTIVANEGGLVAMVAGDEMILGKPGSDVIVKKLVVNHVENHTVDNGAVGGTASNMFNQFGVDASGSTGSVSAPGGDLVLAAGDIWSNAIENVQDLSATAHGDVHFEEAVNITGDMRAEAGLPTVYDSEWVMTDHDAFNTYFEEQPVEIKRGGDIHAKDTITAGGNIDMIANGVQLDAAVEATAGDLKIAGRQSEDPVDGYHDVETAELKAGGDIEISTTGIDRQWGLDGWYTIPLPFHLWHYNYGSWKEMPPLPGTITLNGDVVAGGNLTLYNNTTVTGPAALQAGVDIVLENGEAFYQKCDSLTGTEKLTLDAKTGRIDQGTATISVTGSELIMKQAPTLDLAGRSFDNQENTHLTLESYNGSVFATDTADGGDDENAADQWASIGARANGGIILSGSENDIKARRLEAAHGPIEVDAKTHDILLKDHLLPDDGDDGILASGGGNITLTGNSVTVIGDIEAQYGPGIRPVGYNSDLTIEAADDIEIDGYADIDGDMVLRANMSSGDGDVIARGNLIAGGDIDIYSSDTTTHLGGDLVKAAGNVTLHNDTELDGGPLQRIEATTGRLYADGSVHKKTPGDLEMFGGYNGPLYPDMDYSVKTKAVTVDEGQLSIAGNATVRLDGSIYSSGDMTLASNVDGIASTPSSSGTGSPEVPYDYLIHNSGTIQSLNGDVDLSGSFISLNGGDNPTDAYVSAGGDILLRDYTWVQYDRKLKAVDDVVLAEGKRLQGNGSLTLEAGDDIIIGSTDVDKHWLAPEDDTGTPGEVKANGDLILNAGDDVYVHGELITLDGSGGDIEITASDDTIHLYGNVTADQTDGGDIILHANTEIADGVKLDAGDDVVLAGGKLITGNGDLALEAGDDILLGVANAAQHWLNPGAGSAGDVTANGNLTLDAGDDIYAHGDLTSNNGSIELSSDVGTTYLGGDVTAATDITFNNHTVFDDDDDQKVDAQSGTITAKGWLWKNSYWGSLYLEAAGDIGLADDVEAEWGGVSIISENGSIFTPDNLGGKTDTLNISVYGWSDDYCGDGVKLPHGPGLAAIVISSAEDLKLGTDAELVAEGIYDDTGTVDDRQGIRFLDEPLTSIGGIIRDEGEPFDAAVYLASTGGDVDVSSSVSIMSCEFVEQPYVVEYQYENEQDRYECVPKGAMVIDAWNAVTFDGGVPGGMFETSLADGMVGDRLEVVSRRSEWLFEAVGRLPYVYGGGPFPTDYSYVLRGAGLDNPDITDRRAWVLQDPTPPAPLYEEAGEASEQEEFGEGGCPAMMDWLAAEVGIPADEIQVAVAGTFALSTNVQPCDMCARLMNAANTLQDPEGTRLAALSRVINEFVTTPAPPSEEQMTSIAAAFAEHVDDGTQYAAAGQWIDAVVAYITIMRTEMGYSFEDAAAFAEKYLAAVNESGNAALTAYVQARIAALGG